MEVEAGVHRIYTGTPEKVAKKRLLEISACEGKPVYRAITVASASEELKDGEIFITHRKISNEHEKVLELAKTGCSEIVVVVESLLLLQENFDEEFFSLRHMRIYSSHVDKIMQYVEGEEKPSFSRFCYGLWKAVTKKHEESALPKHKRKKLENEAAMKAYQDHHLEAKKDNSLHEAAKHCAKLFVEVGNAVAEKHQHNTALKDATSFTQPNVRAWVALYKRRKVRHQHSHPFKLIGNAISIAQAALGVLEYVADKEEYKAMNPLLKAAIPHAKKVIEDHHSVCVKDEVEEEMESERFAELVAQLNEVMVQDDELDGDTSSLSFLEQ